MGGGAWQGQIVGELALADIETIKYFANVKDVVISEKERGETTADIYFEDYEKVLSDMPRIAEQIGVSHVYSDNCTGIIFIDCNYTQFLCSFHERKDSSVWYFFQRRSHPKTDSDMSFAGSGRTLYRIGSAGKFDWHCSKHGIDAVNKHVGK